MKLVFDIISSKLNLANYTKLLELADEMCALGYEYAKVIGECDRVKIHVYVHASSHDLSCQVKTLGMAVELLERAIVDDTVLTLLKYSNTIVKEGNSVLFYINPDFTVGVFYMVCKHSNIKWLEHQYIEPEELEYFSRGEQSW